MDADCVLASNALLLPVLVHPDLLVGAYLCTSVSQVVVPCPATQKFKSLWVRRGEQVSAVVFSWASLALRFCVL